MSSVSTRGCLTEMLVSRGAAEAQEGVEGGGSNLTKHGGQERSEMTRAVVPIRHTAVYSVLIALMILVGCIRICSTYEVFWQTWDEPFQIAAGMEWLAKGHYTYERLNPPLARVMGALGPYLSGIRGDDNWRSPWFEGNAMLHSGDRYERNLTLARIGILPFFIMAALIVALWARNCGGTTASLLATLLFTTLPPILANAGLATLDMASAACVAAALFCLTLYLERPTILHGALLGVVAGLAFLSKMSSIGFLPVAGGLTVAWYSRYASWRARPAENTAVPAYRRPFVTAVIALFLCAFTIWAGYRFSTGPVVRAENRPHEAVDSIMGTEGVLHGITYAILENVPVPAPEFFEGIGDAFERNKRGHLVFFMGEIRRDGWWYYFPIILLVKTPLPFLLLAAGGLFVVFRNVRRADPGSIQSAVPVIAFAAIISFGMLSSINNGIRQILGVYPFLAVIAGLGAATAARSTVHTSFRSAGGALIAILCSWHLVASFAAHPHYLAYFNELAGRHPEQIAVGSDLDQGQDLKLLSRALKGRGIDVLKIKFNGSNEFDLHRFDLPPHRMLAPYQRTTGWIAISVTNLMLGTRDAPYDQFSWLKEFRPTEIIGRSIWLYHIPENS